MSARTPDPPLLGERFDEAIRYAVDHHRTQLRKGTQIPYVAHILAVASIALEIGDSEDEAIAALLHDVVEDGGGVDALVEIKDCFGAPVAAMVEANSDSVAQPKPPWEERKRAYVGSIAAKDPAAVRVSIADKLHNARSILSDLERHGDSLWTRFRTDRDGVLWYYGALVGAFDARRPEIGEAACSALDELIRVVGAIRAEAIVTSRFPPAYG